MVSAVERRELETVVYEKEDAVARIILNRPEKANAQNSAMVHDFEECLELGDRALALDACERLAGALEEAAEGAARQAARLRLAAGGAP